MAKILILPGSSRRASFNRKLGAVAAALLTESGAEAELIDPLDYPLPLYEQDLMDASGLPVAGKELKAKFIAADAILFVSPEYNSCITPMMKNYIDWLSRAESDDEPPLQAFRGKPAGLLSASPGQLGGLRSLMHLRQILGNLGMFVTPKQHALAKAGEQFDESGALWDEDAKKAVRGVVQQLLETTGKLAK